MTGERHSIEDTGCGKRAYTSKNVADREIRRIRKLAKSHQRKHNQPCRSYKCPDCGWWHLTSRDDDMRHHGRRPQ